MPNYRVIYRSMDKKPYDNILYLTGTLDSWNNSKKSEEKDRVKHDNSSNRIVYGLDEYSRVIPITRDCLNQEVQYKIA